MHILELITTTASSALIHATNPHSHSKPTSPPVKPAPVSDLQNVNDFMPELQRVHIYPTHPSAMYLGDGKKLRKVKPPLATLSSIYI
jgi:hypothetical protein